MSSFQLIQIKMSYPRRLWKKRVLFRDFNSINTREKIIIFLFMKGERSSYDFWTWVWLRKEKLIFIVRRFKMFFKEKSANYIKFIISDKLRYNKGTRVSVYGPLTSENWMEENGYFISVSSDEYFWISIFFVFRSQKGYQLQA